MASKTWDFSKIPNDRQKYVIELYEQKDWEGLLEVHDVYRISQFSYECCGGKINEDALASWFKYGIEKGFISAQKAAGSGKSPKVLGG